jgi:hypothetical protein
MRFMGAGRPVAIFGRLPVAVGMVTLAAEHRKIFAAQQRQSFPAV